MTYYILHNDIYSGLKFDDVTKASNEAYYLAVACHPNCDPRMHRVTPPPIHLFEVVDEHGRVRAQFNAATVKEDCADLFPMAPTDWVDHGWDL